MLNTVERLNNHPSLYLNFLETSVGKSKHVMAPVDKEPLAKGESTSSRDRETCYKMQPKLNSPDITQEVYEEMSM